MSNLIVEEFTKSAVLTTIEDLTEEKVCVALQLVHVFSKNPELGQRLP
jgi:hypothetical protein